jgi:hypothetical protein
MKEGHSTPFRRLLVGGLAFSFGAATGVVPALAATAKTVVVTVEVASPFPNPGDVQVQQTDGTVLATCQGSSSAGRATCQVSVAADKGILLVAQPLKAGGFKGWTARCSSAPGPICHIQVGKSAEKAVGHFGSAPPTPSAVTTTSSVFGNTPGCSGFSGPVTVNGTGFPSSTAVTLSDDGHQMASGSTDTNGFVQLSYTANSEPGVYRNLVMGAGGLTATTDIFNSGSFCYYQTGAGTGTDSFQVVGADLDANSTGTIQFANNPPVPAVADASGAYTVTTPSYACPAGATRNLVVKDVRGAGTPAAYHGTSTFAVVC